MLDTDELLAAAGRLCAVAERPAPLSLRQLAGGKNNRVFAVATAGGPALILKSYHADPRDPRDRLFAEWSFLAYVWDRGVRAVPEPLAQERESHTALYTLVPGEKLDAGDITSDHIAQAARFICAANGAPREPDRLQPGSEACFSLADHVATVDRRVARLATLDPDAPHRERAETLVRTGLAPAWAKVRETIRAASDTATLPTAAQCISPSDFGFHNALVDGSGRVSFIDFEYAGRDDPAKLVCDFFCCPEIPVPLRHRGAFIDSLAEGLGLDAAFRLRCDLLLDAYRIKWACIILNDFLPMDAARRDFANPGARDARCAAQLDKAVAKLADIGLR